MSFLNVALFESLVLIYSFLITCVQVLSVSTSNYVVTLIANKQYNYLQIFTSIDKSVRCAVGTAIEVMPSCYRFH